LQQQSACNERVTLQRRFSSFPSNVFEEGFALLRSGQRK